jgi:very-short-patch-repair endonuclease
MLAESAEFHAVQGFSRAHGDDRPLSELARTQHGVVGRTQLLEAGWTDAEIEWRLGAGRLHRIHAGVYAVGHGLLNPAGRWMAALLASGSGFLLSHWSAAALWGVRPNSKSRIDVTSAHPNRSLPPIRRHVSRVHEDERTVERGIPVTTVPRTILDLAATQPVHVVEAMLREAEHLRLHDRLSLRDLVDRYPGRRGVRRVGLALERLEALPVGRTASPLEERFVPFLRRHRLPTPRFNDWIVVGDRRFQVDCHWPANAQIVELDGWQAHGTRSAFREDRARDRALRVAGYSVTRISWAQLGDEPEAIAADLRTLLSQARMPMLRGRARSDPGGPF